MIKHIKLTVKGRVQGVWYRANTKLQADDIGVRGFVKNLIGGNVYIEAEGTQEQLRLFVEWCKNGPSLAQVSHVIEQQGKLEHFTSFEIK